MGMRDRAETIAGSVRSSQGRYPLSKRVLAVPAMVWATLRGGWPGAPKARVFGGIVGVAYVLLPIDLMPEILLGPFGLGDDLAIAAVSVAALLSAAESYLDAKGSYPGLDGAEVVPGTVISRQEEQPNP